MIFDISASHRRFALATALLIGGSGLQAQSCSPATTLGKYLIVCEGYLSPAAGAPLVPAKVLATATFDHNGSIQGKGLVSIGGGPAVTQVVSGKENINHDCTGTVKYTQTIAGQPAPDLNIAFVVSQRGNRIDGLVTDPGAVLSCTLHRTSLNIYASAPQPASPSAPRQVEARSTSTTNDERIILSRNNNR